MALSANQKRILINGYRWNVTMYGDQDMIDMKEFAAQGYFRQFGSNEWNITENGREFVRQQIKEDASWRSEILAEVVMGLMNIAQPGTYKYAPYDKDFAEMHLAVCGVEYTVIPEHDEETGEFLGDWWELKKAARVI